MAALLAAGSAALVWTATDHGMVQATDSAGYLSAAENLASGKGMTSPISLSSSAVRIAEQLRFGDQLPFTHLGPGYPAMIGLLRATGVGLDSSARLVSAAGLAALVLVTAWALRMLLRPPWLPVADLDAAVAFLPTGWFLRFGLVASEVDIIPATLLALVLASVMSKSGYRW